MTTAGGVALPRGPLRERASLRGDSRLDGLQGGLDLPQRCAVTSGRAALVQALRLLGLQPGHAVLAPSFHGPTLAAPVVRLQAPPVFIALGADGLPDLASVQAHHSQSGARVLLWQWLPQAQAARIRRRHSQAALSIWPARHDDRSDAAPTGARALWAEDCGRAEPCVSPVWVDDTEPVYQRLRREGHAVLHWDRRWPGAPADGAPGDADDTGGALERYADLECRGWKERVGTALAPGAALTAFYRGLLETLSGQGRAWRSSAAIWS